jgi:hypothetical protein
MTLRCLDLHAVDLGHEEAWTALGSMLAANTGLVRKQVDGTWIHPSRAPLECRTVNPLSDYKDVQVMQTSAVMHQRLLVLFKMSHP